MRLSLWALLASTLFFSGVASAENEHWLEVNGNEASVILTTNIRMGCAQEVYKYLQELQRDGREVLVSVGNMWVSADSLATNSSACQQGYLIREEGDNNRAYILEKSYANEDFNGHVSMVSEAEYEQSKESLEEKAIGIETKYFAILKYQLNGQ